MVYATRKRSQEDMARRRFQVYCAVSSPVRGLQGRTERGTAMFARSTWGELPPDKVGDLVVALRPSIDAIAQCAGYQGAAVLANRESGAAVVITYWESAETMQASEEVASGTRAAVTS